MIVTKNPIMDITIYLTEKDLASLDKSVLESKIFEEGLRKFGNDKFKLSINGSINYEIYSQKKNNKNGNFYSLTLSRICYSELKENGELYSFIRNYTTYNQLIKVKYVSKLNSSESKKYNKLKELIDGN